MQSDGNILKRKSFQQPIIERIQAAHQKNKAKEYLAHSSKNKYMDDFQHRRSTDNQNRIKKNEEIMAKVHEQHKKLQQTIKRKEEHLHQIYKKSHILDQEKYRLKVKRIKQRQLKYGKEREVSMPGLDHRNQSTFEASANAQAARSFYQKAYNNELQWSLKALEKNQSKQTSAQRNRKKIQKSLEKLKQINGNKIIKKQKADDQVQQRYRRQLKSSVIKLESFLDRSFECKENERSQRKKKEERERKHFEKVQQMRVNLLADITDKFNKVEESMFQKSRKCSIAKQRSQQNSLENKRKRRQIRQAKTQTKFHQKYRRNQQKMDTIYQKDREHWGFVTSVTAFKENLIQKNIYESSQLALQLKG